MIMAPLLLCWGVTSWGTTMFLPIDESGRIEPIMEWHDGKPYNRGLDTFIIEYYKHGEVSGEILNLFSDSEEEKKVIPLSREDLKKAVDILRTDLVEKIGEAEKNCLVREGCEQAEKFIIFKEIEIAFEESQISSQNEELFVTVLRGVIEKALEIYRVSHRESLSVI